jgi:hypothetical protein
MPIGFSQEFRAESAFRLGHRATSSGPSRLREMVRYYFHLFNDVNALDQEGQVLPDEAAAMRIAASSARELAAQSVSEGHLDLSHRIEVEAENGQKVGAVSFGDVVKVTKSDQTIRDGPEDHPPQQRR